MPIPPRPIYRWKSFWLGILVLTFLCWTWSNSFQKAQHVTRFQNMNYYQVIHIQGELLFRHGPQIGVITNLPSWKFGNSTNSISAAKLKGDWEQDGLDFQSIPDAAIVGLYTLCFATFIFWRIRRWKRHATALNTTPTP